ncbi:MAG: hypothetical protein V4561_12540 [Bacteroidota bacterium]
MKISVLAITAMLFFCSCTYMPRSYSTRSNNSRALPPGQAKKAYGSPSAKPFAPGQNKKHKH